MRALVLDRTERSATIESVRREGRIIMRKNAQYAMKGVSWAWGKPMYPRWIYALNFVPVIGPVLSRMALRGTFVFVADGVATTLEPQEESAIFVQSMTDEQAKAIMEAHAEALAIGSSGMNPMIIVALVAMVVAAIAVVALVR